MGVGAVVQSTLYKPIAEHNITEISRIYVSSTKFFRNVAYILIAYITILCMIYPSLANSDVGYWNIVVLILAISFKLLIQYYFSITYRLILIAAQLTFVPMAVGALTIIINIGCSVYLIFHDYSIQQVQIISAAIFIIQPVIYIWVVRKLFPIDRKVQLSGEPIKQKWNGFAQHLASISQENSPVIILTLFTNIYTISIYSVYHMVTNGLKLVFSSFMTGVHALLGDMYARREMDKLYNMFYLFEWFTFLTGTLIYTIAGITIIPFVKIYLNGITDINYIYPAFGWLMCLSMALYTIRLPYNYMIQAAGHFKQTQNSAFIELGISLFLSCLLVTKFNFIGVAISACIAIGYRTVYFVIYLSRHILYKNPLTTVKLLLVSIFHGAIMIITTNHVHFKINSLMDWTLYALIIAGICTLETIILHSIVYKKQLVLLKRMILTK